MAARVLVVGAGGAGLAAALSAVHSGAEVCVVSKTRVGMNTCTAYSGGMFALASGDVTPQAFFEKTMRAGQNVNNPALVRVLADESEQSLRQLAAWGVDIRFPSSGWGSVRHTAPYKLMAGSGMMQQAAAAAARAGVRFAEFTAVTRLRVKNGRVVGADLTDWRTGRTEFFAADAVVLACGGGGRMFSRTDNPVRMTGDGYALALDAGAELIDMEFTQFYPVGWAEPGLPVWMADLCLADFLPVTDSEGNEFLLDALHRWGYKDGREGNLYARDRCSVLIEQTHRRGGAFAHFECLSDEQRRDKGVVFSLILDVRRFDSIRRPVRIEPLQHYMCGGVKIDENCRTGIGGLYACGEVSGGVDGANRIGGNALSNIVTFGIRAGANAAAESAGARSSAEAEPNRFSDEGHAPRELRTKLQNTMWRCLGPVRTKQSITEALQFLDELKTQKMAVRSPQECLEALEMPGLAATSRAVALAALARKKSLGTHYRADSLETE